jgi:hypothetical protein
MIQGLGFRVQGLGFRIQGLGFRICRCCLPRHDRCGGAEHLQGSGRCVSGGGGCAGVHCRQTVRGGGGSKGVHYECENRVLGASGVGFRVQGVKFRIQGFGFKV